MKLSRNSLGQDQQTDLLDTQHIFSTARDHVDYCMRVTELKSSMIASLLNVSKQMLDSWVQAGPGEVKSEKQARLMTLSKIVARFEESGIKGMIIINLLNDAIPGDEQEKTLLHFVVDDPDNSSVIHMVDKVIVEFKKK